MAEQIEVPGTERKYSPAIKSKLKKVRSTRGTKAEAYREFKKAEADLIAQMKEENEKIVVDDSTVPAVQYVLGNKDTLVEKLCKPEGAEPKKRAKKSKKVEA